MNAIVDIQGLSKHFGGNAVLSGLDLVLPAGTTTVLLGANGAGKSTLLRVLLGLERPDAGTVNVAGLDPFTDARAVRQRVGYVPDQPDVYDWMSPRELYEFLAPQYPRWDGAVLERVCARLGVRQDVRFSALSRGEAAKAMLAAALAPQPDVYLLDEAFSGLDPLVRDEVLGAFLAEAELETRAALIVTHELDLAARLADRIAVLRDGEIELHDELDAKHGISTRVLKELLHAPKLERSAVQ